MNEATEEWIHLKPYLKKSLLGFMLLFSKTKPAGAIVCLTSQLRGPGREFCGLLAFIGEFVFQPIFVFSPRLGVVGRVWCLCRLHHLLRGEDRTHRK